MSGLFITATGTEVGKTFVTCGLLHAARRAGLATAALKPVLTGFARADAIESDAGRLLTAQGVAIDDATIAGMSPWRYAAPLAPSMAAAVEGRDAPDLAAVVAYCRAVLAREPMTLIEGIGGLMVPLDRRHTVLDLAVELALPILLVSPTALGAISHALTAMAALAARGLVPTMVLLVQSPGAGVSPEATRTTLLDFCPGVPIAILPRDPPDRAFDALLAALTTSREPRTAA